MMYWQEPERRDDPAVPDDVVDVLFSLQCRMLPVDHAYALSQALLQAVPWLGDEPTAAVHTIHVAGSQNGWERPEHGTEQYLLPSRRTKLRIRVPTARLGGLRSALEGRTLEIDGAPLTLGSGKEQPLSRDTTLFARHVVAAPDEDEDAFLARIAERLAGERIQVRKALCGRSLALATPDGPLPTRSLMLADLSIDESIRLQQQGIGPGRHMGCGVFLPHKGIEAAGSAQKR